MPLLIAFAYFILEGWFLFRVAEQIGFLQVLLLLGAAALLGLYLVRSKGFNSFTKANRDLMLGVSPQEAVLDGIVLLLCGIILIVPGLLSDILVLPLLIPPLRRAVVRRMEMRLTRRQFDFQSGFNRKEHGQLPRDKDNFFHNDGHRQSGKFNGFGANKGPFVFYRFFVRGTVYPRPGSAKDYLYDPGYSPDRDKNSTDEYKVIVHDDKQVIDVTAEKPDNDESEIRKG